MIEALLIGLLIGLVIGLTGAGGSIIAVPLLTLVLDLPLQQSMGVSLGSVGCAAWAGLFFGPKEASTQQWTAGILLASMGMLFAPLGRWLSSYIHEFVLLVTFSLLAATIAVRMYKIPEAKERNLIPGQTGHVIANTTLMTVSQTYKEQSWLTFAKGGIVAGLLSGFYGVGGGFFIVPWLQHQLRMPLVQATYISLLVIALISASGFAFYSWFNPQLPTNTLVMTILGATIGVMIGRKLQPQFSEVMLSRGFAVLLSILLIVTWIQLIL